MPQCHPAKKHVAQISSMMASAAVSCSLELVQGSLPARVPSGLDFFCNAMGGIVGAWLALILALQPDGLGRLRRWRHRAIRHGTLGDLALVTLAYWLFLQFRPDVWLFAAGSPGRVDPSPLGAYSAASSTHFNGFPPAKVVHINR